MSCASSTIALNNKTHSRSEFYYSVGMTGHFSNLFLDDLALIDAYVARFGPMPDTQRTALVTQK